jgi:hypothetical protein
VRIALVVLLAGCNQIFDLKGTELDDAGAVPPDDSLHLLRPPDGSTTCGAAIDFSTWTFAPHTVAGIGGVIHPTFIAGDRVVFMYQTQLYESGLDAGPTKIPELGMSAQLFAPSAAPFGDVFWYLRVSGIGGSGIFYATKSAGTWTGHLADLGLIANQVQTGQPGFFGGRMRMVVMVQPSSNDRLRLIELDSPDGLTWTQLATLPWSSGSTSDYDPALSADGCTLVFARQDASSANLYAAARQSDGMFALPAQIPGGSDLTADEGQPALDPTMTRLWFTGGVGGLTEGRAP